MITYYTDGSCSPNPGPGGFAVIKDMQPTVLGAEKESTNIRMEGKAIIAALQDANGAECQIYTDSEFWINVITKWSIGWEQNGWKKKGGEIKNLDIVKEVCPLYRNSNAALTWVRGHANDPGNELADEWANTARERFVKGQSLEITQTQAVEQTPKSVPELIMSYLPEGKMMQVATVSGERPWICTVYYVHLGTNLYWLSLPDRRHSQEIAMNNKVAIAIAVKSDFPVIGIQAEGNASVVAADEIAEVMQHYVSKYGEGQDFYDNFMAGKNKHLLYKCIPNKFVLFDEVTFARVESRKEWSL